MDEWKPIATAPKDGTVLLFWTGLVEECGSHQIGLWFDGIWLGDSYCGKWETLDGVALEGTFSPTHWMPLPSPPYGFPANIPPEESACAANHPIAPQQPENGDETDAE